jgi:hypothetical protein
MLGISDIAKIINVGNIAGIIALAGLIYLVQDDIKANYY